MNRPEHELTLIDALTDPLVQSAMAADHVDPRELPHARRRRDGAEAQAAIGRSQAVRLPGLIQAQLSTRHAGFVPPYVLRCLTAQAVDVRLKPGMTRSLIGAHSVLNVIVEAQMYYSAARGRPAARPAGGRASSDDLASTQLRAAGTLDLLPERRARLEIVHQEFGGREGLVAVRRRGDAPARSARPARAGRSDGSR